MRKIKKLQPDWVIISHGTNESYNRQFSAENFYRNLTKLITRIQKNTNHAWILLTTPGHSFRKKKFKNPDNAMVRDQIIRAANEYNCGYWNFCNIMGDADAINLWSKNNLTASDKIHLSKAGYQLKATRFFDAFLKNFSAHFNRDSLKP
ncbi:MAG: GDSL-type esterase/lipase family protein [Bacteroidales bacterium]